MKILIAHGSGPHPASYPRILSEELRRIECEVVLHAIPAPGAWASRLRAGVVARRLLAEHGPDLVHVIAPDPAAVQAFEGQGVSILHSTIDRPSGADWVVAPSREALLRVRRAAPSLDYRVTRLPFALDPGEPALGAGSYALARFDPRDAAAARWVVEAAAALPDVPIRDEGDAREARFLIYASSEPEAWPAGVPEALAAGRPVIASWGGAASEFVGESVSGFLCAPGDVRGLAGNVEYLWNHPGEALFLGMQAREEAKSLFGAAAHARALLKTYLRAGASRLAV